jgi:hypothetical protein
MNLTEEIARQKSLMQINENGASIGANGELSNFNKPTGYEAAVSFFEDSFAHDHIMSDEEFNNSPKDLKDIYVALLFKELVLLSWCNNKSLLEYINKYYHQALLKMIPKYTKMYSTFGNDHFPFSDTFIKECDITAQELMVRSLVKHMRNKIFLDEETLSCFYPKIRELIENNFNPLFKIF